MCMPFPCIALFHRNKVKLIHTSQLHWTALYAAHHWAISLLTEENKVSCVLHFEHRFFSMIFDPTSFHSKTQYCFPALLHCMHVFLFTWPVTSHPFLLLSDWRGWEAMAGIITSQNTRRPLSSATATQHYNNTFYRQVDRSCVPQRRDMKEGGTGNKEDQSSTAGHKRGKMRKIKRKRMQRKIKGNWRKRKWKAQFIPREQITTIPMGIVDISCSVA